VAVGIQYYGAASKRPGIQVGPPSPYLNPDGTVKGSSIGPTLPVGPTSPSLVPEIDLSGNISDTGIVSTGGSSSQSGAAAWKNALLNETKYNAEIDAAKAAREAAAKGAQYQLDYLKNQIAGAGQIPASLLEQFAQQQSTGEGYINQQYKDLLDQLTGRKTLAEQTTTTGYDALRNYLAQNQPTAYAQAANAVPEVVQNALAQYMQSQGVNPETAQPAVEAANAAALGGTTNYNELLNVLRAREQSGQQSRLAEEQMARQLGLQNIQSLYGAGTSGLEQQKLAALADLSSRVQASKLQAEQQRIAREQALSDALAALYGTGYVPYTPPPTDGGTTDSGTTATAAPAAPTVLTPAERLASQVANATNKTLINKVNTFVEKNPNATQAQIAKAFPKLAAVKK
jgi:hypothetical protein